MFSLLFFFFGYDTLSIVGFIICRVRRIIFTPSADFDISVESNENRLKDVVEIIYYNIYKTYECNSKNSFLKQKTQKDKLNTTQINK